ncbi:hypothetical protein vBEcoMNBG1_138 [Escherichia phage vB_EcoM_NBG1]|uniref:Uncharacterized protein n=1 Tax=Escherichia phage vB_EcoM_NBG1 TaxID=2184698 RepID=A0A2U8QP85_9CAUD|nr:hypothetical protein vBEcoMNBG1_138 [Escherichia phage vB_EcoM_NBG1]
MRNQNNDIDSMFEEFRDKVNPPTSLVDSLRYVATGRKWYWSSSYETTEKTASHSRKSLLTPGIMIHDIGAIAKLVADHDIRFTDFVAPTWSVCCLNTEWEYISERSKDYYGFRDKLLRSNMFYIDTEVLVNNKKYYFTLIVDSETMYEGKPLLKRVDALSAIDALYETMVVSPNFTNNLILEQFIMECREYVKANPLSTN